VLLDLQCRLAVLDIERQLDCIQIRPYTGITTQSPVKCPDHSTGESLADLHGDHLGSTTLALLLCAHTSTRTTLLEAGATHPAFIDKL
jgi:hypothetical protein